MDECQPDPVHPRPTTPTIGGGGYVPQAPAEVAGWDEEVVGPEKRDQAEKGKGTNKKEDANLKCLDEGYSNAC